jgi:glycosyltransferase involved in cell wall biosynthesis
LNILHVNTSDCVGGASRATYRLHTGLRRLGHDSFMYVAKRCSDDPNVISFRPPASLSGRAVRYLRRQWIALGMKRYRMFRAAHLGAFSDDRVAYKGAVMEQLPPSNVLNLHWISRFIDYETFFAHVPQLPPIIWTLHDMSSFTGGCHYAHDCERYMNGCGICPHLGSSDRNDLSHRIWHRKQRCLEKLGPGKLHLVVPSHWLAAKVANSALLGRFPVTHIPNSVDIDIFSPRDCHLAREVLGIPQDGLVVLYIAQRLHNRHKGLAQLMQALTGLCDLPNLFLVSVGYGEFPAVVDVPHLHLGYLDDERLLSLVYSAANLLAIPSSQDNLPNTVLESMACGVPVVGFETGGIPDMVRPGVTGLLVPVGDVIALRDAIARLLKDSAGRAEMEVNCRRVATEEYALEVQARRYVALYRRVLEVADPDIRL